MSCSKKVLASRDKFGCVHECKCGTIHVSIGSVDMKFTRGGLMELQAMLAEAVECLHPRSVEIAEVVSLLAETSQPLIN